MYICIYIYIYMSPEIEILILEDPKVTNREKLANDATSD